MNKNKVYMVGKVYVIAKNTAHALKIKKENKLVGALVELTLNKGA